MRSEPGGYTAKAVPVFHAVQVLFSVLTCAFRNMDLDSSDEEIYLLARLFEAEQNKRKRKRRQIWAKNIWKNRLIHGEFHTIFEELKNDSLKFYEYYRMEYWQFLKLTDLLRVHITKTTTNYRCTIPAEERLTVTLSTVLLAVVDAKYNFLIVDVGSYGKNSDGGILQNSKFGKKLNTNKLKLPPNKPLPNTTESLPHVFIGDEVFPLSNNILRPNMNLLTAITDNNDENSSNIDAGITIRNKFKDYFSASGALDWQDQVATEFLKLYLIKIVRYFLSRICSPLRAGLCERTLSSIVL
ncbi:hypothetical protein HF086_015656, partial [Spodoptera exigua]